MGKPINTTCCLKPFYAIRSDIVKEYGDPELEETINRYREKIKNGHPRGLYTVGYQGFSIDGFARTLIIHHIKYLVDARKNAFSMRPEFCGNRLR